VREWATSEYKVKVERPKEKFSRGKRSTLNAKRPMSKAGIGSAF
jgi:hypothetical protein